MLMYDDYGTMFLFLFTIFVIALLEFFKHRTERNPPRDAVPGFLSTIMAPEEDRDTTARGTSRRENGATKDIDIEKISGEKSNSLRSQPDGVSINSMEESTDPPRYEDLQSQDGRPSHLKLCNARTHRKIQRRLLKRSLTLRNFGFSGSTDSGFCSERSSYMCSIKDLNILADADPVQLGINTFSATETIGSEGGTVAIAGCTILIPKKALDHEETIEMKCFFNVPSNGDDICITPTIFLGPNGLKFKKEVIIILPTCYKSINPVDLLDVMIQISDGEEWCRHCVVKNSFPGKIVFKTVHFSWFRSLVQSIFQSQMVKMIRYSGYIKRLHLQDIPLMHTLVWCFCDNLDVFVAQLDSEMKGSYEKVILSETFPLKYPENLKIVNKSGSNDVIVNPVSSVVHNNDLWLPGSVRKLQFCITRNSTIDMSDIVFMNFVLTSGRRKVRQAEYPRNGNYSFAWKNPPIPTDISNNFITLGDTIVIQS